MYQSVNSRFLSHKKRTGYISLTIEGQPAIGSTFKIRKRVPFFADWAEQDKDPLEGGTDVIDDLYTPI